MASTKSELSTGVYSMLEALTVFGDHAGLVSAIGPVRAADFNALLRKAQEALPGVGTVHRLDVLTEYDVVVMLVGRLTILKSIIDHATIRQWQGHRDWPGG